MFYKAYLLPSLNLLWDDSPIIQVGLLEQLKVNLWRQLRGGGQHKGDRGQDHHRQRQESKNLNVEKNVKICYIEKGYNISWCLGNTWIIPGLPEMFPDILSSSKDISSKPHTCCLQNPLPAVAPRIFVDTNSRIQFPEKFGWVLFAITWDITYLELTDWPAELWWCLGSNGLCNMDLKFCWFRSRKSKELKEIEKYWFTSRRYKSHSRESLAYSNCKSSKSGLAFLWLIVLICLVATFCYLVLLYGDTILWKNQSFTISLC